MSQNLTYVDREGHELSLVHLDTQERKLVRRLVTRATQNPDWDDFDSYWPQKIQRLYVKRGVPGKVIAQTTVFQIAQDLSSRLGIACGDVRANDYLSDLEGIIHNRFDSTNRAFCKATGLSEDMLSHVLAGRKDFSMQSLAQALDKIGFRLRILPKPATTLPIVPKIDRKTNAKSAGTKKAARKVG